MRPFVLLKCGNRLSRAAVVRTVAVSSGVAAVGYVPVFAAAVAGLVCFCSKDLSFISVLCQDVAIHICIIERKVLALRSLLVCPKTSFSYPGREQNANNKLGCIKNFITPPYGFNNAVGNTHKRQINVQGRYRE